MEYELYEELKGGVERVIEEKGNPKEVVETLSALINHIVQDHLMEGK